MPDTIIISEDTGENLTSEDTGQALTDEASYPTSPSTDQPKGYVRNRRQQIMKGTMWKGKYYVIPQAASFIDSSALTRSPLGNTGKTIIMGDFAGLMPSQTLMQCGSPMIANNLIDPKYEEARLAARLAFAPSPGGEVHGASEIYLLAVGALTPATITLSNAVALTSYIQGDSANRLQVQVKTGTITNSLKMVLSFDGNQEILDNIVRPSFSIQYTGTGSAATMTITPTAAGHSLTTTCTGATGDNLSFDLLTFPTIQALVTAINGTGKYTATVTTPVPTQLSINLDGATAVDIKTAAFSASSNLQAVVDAFNLKSGYASATRVVDAVAAPSTMALPANFTGGTSAAATGTDWDNALTLLTTINADLILPLTSNPAYHDKVNAHCAYMSGPDGKSERRCFIGGALQTWTSPTTRAASITALKAAVKALGSDLAVHVGLGCWQYDPKGEMKLYPAYITAAMYIGIASGNGPAFPLTKKYLHCLGLETELQPSEIGDLIEAGVAVPAPDTVRDAGYQIVRQITTWGATDDLYRTEFSVGRGCDYIAREVRKRHELLIGSPGTFGVDASFITMTNGVLQDAKDADIIRDYDPKLTAIRADNTIRFIDYSATPVQPINWAFSTYHLQATVTL